MLWRIFTFCLISLTPAIAAVSSQATPKPINDKQKYQVALTNPSSKNSCQVFKTLANKKSFILHEVAEMRHAQNCIKKPNWLVLQKKIKAPILNKFILQSWYQHEFEKKNYKKAYELYHKNRQSIEIDKKEFEELASLALKQKITPKEKNKLRKELHRRAPRFKPRPKKDEHLQVARDYRNDRQFEKALHYYRKVINDPKMSYHQRWHAFKGARITYKLERWKRMEKIYPLLQTVG